MIELLKEQIIHGRIVTISMDEAAALNDDDMNDDDDGSFYTTNSHKLVELLV